MNPKEHITTNFIWAEALCRDGCEIPLQDLDNIVAAALAAEKIRVRLGGHPMRVLSWYRCKEWNAKVGGAPRSQHLLGKAIDFVVKGMSPAEVQAVCLEAQTADEIGGVGKYPGFTHMDIGPKRTWVGANSVSGRG